MVLALVVTALERRSLRVGHVTVRVLTREHAGHATGLGPLHFLQNHVSRVKAPDVFMEHSVNNAAAAVNSNQRPKFVVKDVTEPVYFPCRVDDAMGTVKLKPHATNAADRDGIVFNQAFII